VPGRAIEPAVPTDKAPVFEAHRDLEGYTRRHLAEIEPQNDQKRAPDMRDTILALFLQHQHVSAESAISVFAYRRILRLPGTTTPELNCAED
jgi:hypothetical protein